MTTNVSGADRSAEKISRLLEVIGQPVRIQILLIIAAQEACVCHLEAAIGLRQAGISQHLMVLREAGLVVARRDGRNIFYRVDSPIILDLIIQSSNLLGVDLHDLQQRAHRPISNCPCPQCNPASCLNIAC